MGPDQDPLAYLACADPDLARQIKDGISASSCAYPAHTIRFLVDEILWGVVQELSFGQAYARGIAAVIRESGEVQLQRYCTLVRKAGENGPTLGKLFAEALVPVVVYAQGRFIDRFLQVTGIMRAKGTYTLKDALGVLTNFLTSADGLSAARYLDLLADVFERPLTYNRCLVISKRLPRLVAALDASRRPWQLLQLQAVMRVDDSLLEPFFEGLEKEVTLLSEKALARFVARGLEKFSRDRSHGIRFFELVSISGLETCRALQVAVPLGQVRQRLDRYLQARVGRGVTVKAFSEMPAAYVPVAGRAHVCFDGAVFYLKDVINRFATRKANAELYLCLVRLESGCAEFGTFEFDLEKAVGRYGIDLSGHNFPDTRSDLQRFLSIFSLPALAADLFTIVEYGRHRQRFSSQYPGLERMAVARVGGELARLRQADRGADFLRALYARIALGGTAVVQPISTTAARAIDTVACTFNRLMAGTGTVETSAAVVWRVFPEVLSVLAGLKRGSGTPAGYPGLKIPFGRKIRPDFHNLRSRREQQLAARVKRRLEDAGFKIYRSDLVKLLQAKSGRPTLADIRALTVPVEKSALLRDEGYCRLPDPGTVYLLDLLPELENSQVDQVAGSDHVCRYPEWDCTQNDYLMDHTRLAVKTVPGSDNGFYTQTLRRYQGLVKQIRKAFELLKPEGVKILRQWIEGDDFDYRALLDFALDKKAGIMPSDRLYMKRMKSVRDVAVLLLVDLSKSTANTVQGSADTVLDIEKEAIVLFCEALEVVGDTYAVSGFSGTGRLGVDFFSVKDFDEVMGAAVQARINAMASQRNTRMGTALRHATRCFETVDTSVKLLVVLGDGYPNDTGYKKEYALEDTRKAVFEARSKNVHTHGITVNIHNDLEMDDLYGPAHHTVISNVRELPDKLWRIYSSLTC